jgi:hypothetical protein
VFCVQGASPGSSTCPSGSGPDPWLTFTVTDQGDTRIEGTITLASNVQAGPRTVYVASPNGNSNTLAFAVQGDLTPYVDQISPGGLDAGQSLSMTITGSNFGPACDASGTPCPGAGIAVCVSGASPCTVSDVTVSNVAWGDTSITATFNAESTASGPYDVVVTSAGASGLGFFAAPNGPQRQSNRGSVVVAVKGNPNLVLIVKSLTAGAAGPPVQMNPGDCAYVNSSNQMPQISADLPTECHVWLHEVERRDPHNSGANLGWIHDAMEFLAVGGPDVGGTGAFRRFGARWGGDSELDLCRAGSAAGPAGQVHLQSLWYERGLYDGE